MARQFIYKLNVNSINIENYCKPNEKLSFFTISNVVGFMLNLLPLIKYYSVSSLLKLLIKTLITEKIFYFTKLNGVIVSDGEVTFGYCNHYTIEKNDCVIGPVNTSEHHQGKGIATFSLKSCVKILKIEYSTDNIFIDTKEDNFAMQKVIRNTGFGEQIGFYNREGGIS